MAKRIELKKLSIFYGDFKAVEDVDMMIEPRSVTAFIRPRAVASPPCCVPWIACST